MSRSKQQAACHPECDHYGKSLCRSCYMKQYIRKQSGVRLREVKRASCKRLKTQVLTVYGRNGHLHCCWDGCSVIDVDMLTLDHIHDDGFLERKESRLTGSVVTYRAALAQVDHEKYQTLCWNHQWKKRLKSLESSQASKDSAQDT